MTELTTSGLTHTCDKNIFGMCDGFLAMISPRFMYKSEPIVDYNYGIVNVDEKSITLEIKGTKLLLSQKLAASS